MNVSKAWLRGREVSLGIKVLEEVLPEDCRYACRQGLLEIHSLHRYFDREVVCPELPTLASYVPPALWPLQWTGELLRWLDLASTICLTNFDVDFSQAFAGSTAVETQALLRGIFDHLEVARPGATIHVNLGASVDSSAASCAGALLEFLDGGATRTNPFVILRVREGVNLHPDDPLFWLTQRALDLSRFRQGIAFSLMDSALNCEWLEFVAYTGDGLRMEPLHGDFFRGARGTSINGIVTVNVPESPEVDWSLLQRTLHLAGRILAQKLELLGKGVLSDSTPGTNVINIAGLQFSGGASRLGSFEMIDKIKARVAQMAQDFGLSLTLASIECLEGISARPYNGSALALEAERQHQLRGGHSLVIPVGAHTSWQDLHQYLRAGHAAGVSFMRFSAEDIRCGSCHLPVAADGPCPTCGSEARRRVDFVEGKLQSVVTGEPIL